METMLKRLVGERVEVMIISAPGVLRIKADQGQIEQVIVNLAMNSRDAMPEGGKFMIETSAVEFSEETSGRPEASRPADMYC